MGGVLNQKPVKYRANVLFYILQKNFGYCMEIPDRIL